jgi:probable phosphoglycerate mutase
MRRLIVETDGGSRGNPGPAGYGAVVRDAGTGEVLAEVSESIGTASNNVAEYSGLIAGLRAAAQIDPRASVEVRMDSRLIVEQMSGRWRIKHPDMRPLALAASEAARSFSEISYTWVPRERNKHADRLANEAMDAAERGGGGTRRNWPGQWHTGRRPPRDGRRDGMGTGAGAADDHAAAPARADASWPPSGWPRAAASTRS